MDPSLTPRLALGFLWLFACGTCRDSGALPLPPGSRLELSGDLDEGSLRQGIRFRGQGMKADLVLEAGTELASLGLAFEGERFLAAPARLGAGLAFLAEPAAFGRGLGTGGRALLADPSLESGTAGLSLLLRGGTPGAVDPEQPGLELFALGRGGKPGLFLIAPGLEAGGAASPAALPGIAGAGILVRAAGENLALALAGASVAARPRPSESWAGELPRDRGFRGFVGGLVAEAPPTGTPAAGRVAFGLGCSLGSGQEAGLACRLEAEARFAGLAFGARLGAAGPGFRGLDGERPSSALGAALDLRAKPRDSLLLELAWRLASTPPQSYSPAFDRSLSGRLSLGPLEGGYQASLGAKASSEAGGGGILEASLALRRAGRSPRSLETRLSLEEGAPGTGSLRVTGSAGATGPGLGVEARLLLDADFAAGAGLAAPEAEASCGLELALGGDSRLSLSLSLEGLVLGPFLPDGEAGERGTLAWRMGWRSELGRGR